MWPLVVVLDVLDELYGFCCQVTKVKLKQKQAEGIAEARSGQRGPVRL
jgi:uncharacterized membrane protein